MVFSQDIFRYEPILGSCWKMGSANTRGLLSKRDMGFGKQKIQYCKHDESFFPLWWLKEASED